MNGTVGNTPGSDGDRLPAPPRGLKSRGRKFWREAVASFEFSDSEAQILIEVCRCMDRLDALNRTINEVGPMVIGSQGQPVVNPALTEARGQQQTLHRLLAALRLPDDDGQALASPRSVAASIAGHAAASHSQLRSVK
jgi:hypothetical protein